MNTVPESQDSASPMARKVVTALAIITLVVGLGLGAYGLFSALGVWMGMWDFRTGFNMLRAVNNNADWAAWVGLIVTIGVFFGARRLAMPNTQRLTAFAAAGTIVAALVYFVPQTYSPAAGTPAIHDITTDTVNPPEYIAIAPLRADAPNNMVYGEQANWDKARMSAAQQEAYPDIVPQEFSESKDVVFARALAAANAMGWEIVDQNLATGRIEATDTTFWFRFKDDVVIVVTPTAQGSVLNARSLSRVGTSDVGKNAARLREFFAQLR